MRSNSPAFSALALLALIAFACAESEQDSGPSGASATGGKGGSSACVPGKQEPCTCGQAPGVQECKSDGSGFLPCSCDDGGATGGSAGAAGAIDGGAGDAGSGGSAGSGCAIGQKKCGGICVATSPSSGCDDPTTCTPCPTPTNGSAMCTAGQCDIVCNSGYQKSGTSCVASSGACNPVDPQSSTGGYTPCAAGQTCVPSPSGATTCTAAGSTGSEQQCTSTTECAPGLVCAKEFIGGFHCIEYCYTNGDCPGTYVCLGTFNPPLYAGTQKVTYCL